jgi:flavin-dependent dehydrogenase
LASATTEIVVLGGGPAGASAARLLATWGHRVRLITRPPGDQRLAVSLPPSCEKLFDVLGVTDAIERGGFVRSTGNTVWWGSPDPRIEMFAGAARGWQAETSALEAVLIDEAARAGVVIEHRVIVAGNPDYPKAAFVLDCTGRTGVIARARNLRQYHDGPKTIALIARWRGVFPNLPDDSHTVIESYRDGWMWSVPTAPGVRHVSAMIDPRRSDLARGESARDVYLGEIAKTRAFKALLSHASVVDNPSGFDASTYYADQYAGDGWLLVGDAGSFIDPLSSAGVKKALASAWLAAIVVNTSLQTPALRPYALEFYAAREQEIEQYHAAETRAFLASAARGHDRPFWAERSADVATVAADEEAIKTALDRLRRAESLRVTVAECVRIEPRPIVDGNEIRLAPHVVTPGSSAVRYINAIDMVTLLELAPEASQVPELFEIYVRRTRAVPLHDFLMALSSAVARGWLVSE